MKSYGRDLKINPNNLPWITEQTNAPGSLLPAEEVMTALIELTRQVYTIRDTVERQRMRLLLNAASSQVNGYHHQGSHVWRSKPFNGTEQLESQLQNQIEANRAGFIDKLKAEHWSTRSADANQEAEQMKLTENSDNVLELKAVMVNWHQEWDRMLEMEESDNMPLTLELKAEHPAWREGWDRMLK
jgi:hypothetical protein